MAGQFAFLSWKHGDKYNASDRASIRSQCMKGRNKRAGSRRSLREARRAAKEAGEASNLRASLAVIPLTNPKLMCVASLRPVTEVPDDDKAILVPGSLSPPLDPSITQFAQNIKKRPFDILQQVLRFVDLTNGGYMYMIESYVDFDIFRTHQSHWPFYDDAFLHTVLLTNSALTDFSLKRSQTKTTQFHLIKALSLLNQRLSDTNAYLTDSTIYIALCLAVMAGAFGDYTATGAHLAGLHRLIAMRGGPGYLEQQPKLQYKLESLDLIWCLAFGGEPKFIQEPVSWGAFFTPSFSANTPASLLAAEHLDQRLVAAFRDLQQLTAVINHGSERNTRLSARSFQPAMSSIQARLLHLKDDLGDCLSECLCLATLAFLTTTFQLPGRKIKYPYLSQKLQQSCRAVDLSDSDLKELGFWLLVVCGTSVFEPDERWLCESWKRFVSPMLSWEVARQRLQKVLWIGSIHDTLGKQTFADLASYSQ